MERELQCSASTIKYLLFFFNLNLVLCGTILVTLGAVALHSEVVTAAAYNTGLYIAIGVGVFSFLVAFLGCCAAILRHRCLLLAFASCLLVIILVEFTGVILIFTNYDDAALGIHLKTIFISASVDRNSNAMDIYDSVQTAFSCCGFMSYSDWPPLRLPQSCCDSALPAPSRSACSARTAYPVGCLLEVTTFTHRFASAVGGIGIAVLLVQVAGVGLSIFFVKQLSI